MPDMNNHDVDYYVEMARGDGGWIAAMWAGIEAKSRARPGEEIICPFEAAETRLVAGFERGVAIDLKPVTPVVRASKNWQGSTHAARTHRED